MNESCSCQEVRRMLEEMEERIMASGKVRGPRKKRSPSAYNRFIADCMRGGKEDMKTCAAEYKRQKESR